MAALRGERLWRIPLSGTEAGEPTSHLQGTNGRLRAVVQVPNTNALWVTTSNADNTGRRPAGSDHILRVDLGT